MPGRKSVSEKIPTPVEIQGEDAWVIIKNMRVGDMRKAIVKSGGKIDEKNLLGVMEMSQQMLQDNVMEWNWCDEQGVPLPQIKDDPAVFDDLTTAEITYLSELIGGKLDEARKKK